MPSVEVMLTSIANSDVIEVFIMALQAEKGNMMDILRNKTCGAVTLVQARTSLGAVSAQGMCVRNAQ